MPFRIALLLTLAGASTAIPAMAQTAHFSGAEVPSIYNGSAVSIVMDQSGNLYIADQQDNKVLKETPSATGWVQSVVDSSLSRVDAVAVDKTGVVYVVDSSDLKVVKEVPFGSIYIQESVAINLDVPQAVAVDSNLNVYIAENNTGGTTSDVIKETPSGSGYIKSTVATGLNSPFGLAADSSGNVYIADTSNNRVLEETPSGSSYSQSTVASGLNEPSGLTLDANGSLYIADLGNDRIVKEAYFFGWHQSTVPTPTLFSPNQVAFDPAGNLYIADDYNGVGRILEMAYTGANFTTAQLGVQDGFLNLMFTFDTAGTLGTGGYKILTEGVANGDFADAQAGTCKGGTNYAAGANCWVTVNFTPKAPGVRRGAVALLNSSGQTIATGYVYGIGLGPQSAFTPVLFSFIPYTGYGSVQPYGVAVDGKGDVFLTDTHNNRILKETWNGSTYVESVLGSGLSSPGGIALDGAGNLYIADSGNNRVLEEMYSNGSYTQSIVAQGLLSPGGVAVDISGNVYIADTLNSRILEESVVDGVAVQTVFPIAGLLHPTGVAVDGLGRILVADTGNDRGLSVVPHPDGTVSVTILDSNLSTPYGVAADGMNNAYFANYGAAGVVKEIANSDGSYTYSLLPTIALANPYGVAVDRNGNVYVADVGDAQVMVESYAPPQLNFKPAIPGFASPDSPVSVTVENIGNEPLAISGVTFPTDFPQAPNVPLDCTSSTSLAANGTCTVTIDFLPPFSSAIGPRNESVVLTDNNLNGTGVQQSIGVSGSVYEPPSMTSPTPGSTLPGSSATFTWNQGSGPTEFQLIAGTTDGGSDVYNGATITGNSAAVTGIPTTGAKLYVRINYYEDNAWAYVDNVYTEAGPPALISPAPGSTLTGSSATFTWANNGVGSLFKLRLGSSLGGSDIYDGPQTTGTSEAVTGIPTYGVTVYARLFYLVGSTWSTIDYTYKEAGSPQPPALTSPKPGTTLTGSSATFTWTNKGEGSLFKLRVGTTVGAGDIYNGPQTTGTSEAVTGLPTYGVTLYVRLYYLVGSTWSTIDYTYTEAGSPQPPAMTSPKPGSTLTGSSATFTWAYKGEGSLFKLRIGSTLGGSDVYDGPLTTGTSEAVTGLPTYGTTLYVRLYYLVGSTWSSIDYTYIESGSPQPPALILPAPGSTLTGSSATFTWAYKGEGSLFKLRIGTTLGGSDIYNGPQTTGTSEAVTGIPTTGAKLYVRLFYEVGTTWSTIDYTYTEQ